METFEEAAYTEDGLHVNSDFLDGLNKEDAIAKIVAWLEEKGCGQEKVTYRLRDWLFSRQRYWGEPIPIIIGKIELQQLFLKVNCHLSCL